MSIFQQIEEDDDVRLSFTETSRKEAGMKKSAMCADHFELGTFKADDQLRANILPGFCLDFLRATEGKRGICVHPKETFVYKPKEGHSVYICEAGLPKHQADSLEEEQIIKIYVTTSCGKEGRKFFLVGTVSKKHAKFNLGMMLPAEIELSHTSDRKTVYFNAFELKCRLKITELKCRPKIKSKCKSKKRFPEVYNHMKTTNKDLWVANVTASQQLEFRPTSEGKIYNLLRVFLETTSIEDNEDIKNEYINNEDIQLFVEYKGVRKSLGSLSDQKPSTDSEFEFEDTFQLSHSSSTSTVVFWGYTTSVTAFKLKDLTGVPSPFFELQPPKKIVDGEYHAHQALSAKRTSGANIKRVNLVSMLAPVIRGFPSSALAASLEFKDTDACGSIGH